MNTITDWTPFWQKFERAYRELPPSYDLLIHATITPEPDVPALSDAIDDLAKEESALRLAPR